ncbi:MAG: bifunctional UDP-N-acetylmuramoyl-tripeptide:D-alanyl-D-alanine ligase/alanine racemase [Sphingobacteriia bacterium]|nr:MAG: bifunctional UDP-N-acetylmuramoyl-tripeptide:D-alanyl-D-alanine ligase/alanine racemase [Sphingobacteriia bacterium]TAG29985.1 MAG: bifunctional UDP-N-acetylmuramoyl-tripeptide:D-alanyl-D-alanine ligase/alanine racemase [Sphingobacteriia bacterium]
MQYLLKEIAAVWKLDGVDDEQFTIQYLVTDSRAMVFPEASLFFAISGPRRKGIDYIADLYRRGMRCFVVDEPIETSDFEGAVFFKVANTVKALQELAAYHRSKFSIPVIAITGSNGKTIVKEWLHQLLAPEFNIIRSPRSFNSQIGVPLSVWQMNEQHTLAIFEAGISTRGEMEALENMIQPTIGVFTNITDAHNEGFLNHAEKTVQKSILFKRAAVLLKASDCIEAPIPYSGKFFSWGILSANDLVVVEVKKWNDYSTLTLQYQGEVFDINIPFTDAISTQNTLTCIAMMLYLRYTMAVIQERMMQLQSVEMRMQLRKAINDCYLLNDSYSNDQFSLSLALNFLKEKSGDQPASIVLSDIVESGQANSLLYEEVVELLKQNNIKQLYAIGEGMVAYFTPSIVQHLPFAVKLFSSTDQFLNSVSYASFQREYILLKGARRFEFERIAHWLELQVHQTVLEVNLTAMVENLKIYQSLLSPTTKLMAMVKAFSYGSGAGEVAKILQQQKVDYLAVAYADEGVALRKAGIHLPIMVMSVDEQSFDVLINYSLEPEIFSFEILKSFQQYIKKQGLEKYPIHIKLNTGMNRLGFDKVELPILAAALLNQQAVKIKTVLSHLVASEDPAFDGFTAEQCEQFTMACSMLEKALGYSLVKHIANTAAIQRNAALQLDMVRLGIGLYGVDTTPNKNLKLATVASLKSTIAQVRKLSAGETVGYSRAGKLERDSVIATVRIGYADGFNRCLGNGVGSMYLHGAYAPVVGKICMDMTMIDITDIPMAAAGDIVEIFGTHIDIATLAAAVGTIPYETMTGVSQRVKRVYIEE